VKLSVEKINTRVWLKKFFLAVLLVLAVYPVCAAGQLAATPPMGWESWNHFQRNINDALIRAQAAAMVSSGMQAVGYTYVNIDGGWQYSQRDSQGNLQPDPNKFPNGIAAVADYVHGLGLKIGIYTSPSTKTCGGDPGSYRHEQQDAETFASWGIDYLKYDWCTCTLNLCGTQQQAFQKMAQALQNTGRPMVYKVSGYGIGNPWTWAPQIGVNLWGTGLDMKDDFYRMSQLSFGENGLESFAGPTKALGNGGWNDPDMLEIGNGGETHDEYVTQMSIWSMLAAPLIAGNDLTTMDKDTLAILTNPEVIAVDQDTLGVQGHRVWEQGPNDVWIKPLADGSIAVGIFNHVGGTTSIALHFMSLGVSGKVQARDLWNHKDLGLIQDGQPVRVAGHGATVLKLTQQGD
jgi:alpha-galactosidase